MRFFVFGTFVVANVHARCRIETDSLEICPDHLRYSPSMGCMSYNFRTAGEPKLTEEEWKTIANTVDWECLTLQGTDRDNIEQKNIHAIPSEEGKYSCHYDEPVTGEFSWIETDNAEFAIRYCHHVAKLIENNPAIQAIISGRSEAVDPCKKIHTEGLGTETVCRDSLVLEWGTDCLSLNFRATNGNGQLLDTFNEDIWYDVFMTGSSIPPCIDKDYSPAKSELEEADRHVRVSEEGNGYECFQGRSGTVPFSWITTKNENLALHYCNRVLKYIHSNDLLKEFVVGRNSGSANSLSTDM